jgi:hypothetical protein
MSEPVTGGYLFYKSLCRAKVSVRRAGGGKKGKSGDIGV